jgi:hypothetical protein
MNSWGLVTSNYTTATGSAELFPRPGPVDMDRSPGPKGPGNLYIHRPGAGKQPGRAGGGGIISVAYKPQPNPRTPASRGTPETAELNYLGLEKFKSEVSWVPGLTRTVKPPTSRGPKTADLN